MVKFSILTKTIVKIYYILNIEYESIDNFILIADQNDHINSCFLVPTENVLKYNSSR